MATQPGQYVTYDSNLLPIFKTFYRNKPVESLFNRMSPVLKAIKWERIGGKTYNFAAQVGRGGGIASDFTVAVANSSSMSRNVEFSIPPGKLFACFQNNQLEIYGSENGEMAYVKAAVAKLHASVEGIRQALAAAFYASGWGEVGYLPGLVANAATTMFVANDTAIKLDVGDIFDVSTAANLLPGGTMDTGTGNAGYTVATIAPTVSSGVLGYNVTFSPGVVNGAGWASGAAICRHGSGGNASGTGNPASLLGLAAWIPAFFSRSGANWTTYIGTTFYGVNRAVNQDKLAGQYYQRQGTYGTGTFPYTGSGTYDRYIDAVTIGVRLARRGGCSNEDILIAINDEDFFRVSAELLAATTYMQMVNTNNKQDSSHYQRGIESFNIDYSTSGTRNIFDDPYCPKGTCYVLDKDCVEFVVLSNPHVAVENGVAENQPGVQPVESTGDFDKAFKLIIDDFLFNAPLTTSPDGPTMLTAIGIYGNYVVHNPAHCAVVNF